MRLNVAIGYDKLTLEEKIRRSVRAAKLEMHPVWTEAMRKLPGTRKMHAASEMFAFAREVLYVQELEHGKTSDDAKQAVIKRIMNSNDW